VEEAEAADKAVEKAVEEARHALKRMRLGRQRASSVLQSSQMVNRQDQSMEPMAPLEPMALMEPMEHGRTMENGRTMEQGGKWLCDYGCTIIKPWRLKFDKFIETVYLN